jgi:hypothetical protein
VSARWTSLSSRGLWGGDALLLSTDTAFTLNSDPVSTLTLTPVKTLTQTRVTHRRVVCWRRRRQRERCWSQHTGWTRLVFTPSISSGWLARSPQQPKHAPGWVLPLSRSSTRRLVMHSYHIPLKKHAAYIVQPL